LLEQADRSTPHDRNLGRVDAALRRVQTLGVRMGSLLVQDSKLAEQLTALSAGDANSNVVQLVSQDPRLLDLPWELARVPDGDRASELMQLANIARVRPQMIGAQPFALGDRLRVVSVAPRPFGDRDVGRRGTTGPWVAAAVAWPHEVELNLVRPRTWEATREELWRWSEIDVFHFDGHGLVSTAGDCSLVFETSATESTNVVGVAELTDVLRPLRPGLVLLNACNSAQSSAAGSLAFALAGALPGTSVVGMRYAVRPSTLEGMLTRFLPSIIDGEDVVVALGRACRSLVSSDGQPDHLVPVVYGPLVDVESRELGSRDARATLPPLPDDIWSLIGWEENLYVFDDLIHRAQGAVTVTGPVQSGKTTFTKLYTEYARITGSRAVPDFESRMEESRDCLGAGSADTFVMPPVSTLTAARWLNRTLSGDESEAGRAAMGTLGFEITFLMGNDIGSMILSDRLRSRNTVRDTVTEFRFPSAELFAERSSLPGEIAVTVDQALERYPETILLGAMTGGPVHSGLMPIVTHGGLRTCAYESLIGVRKNLVDWRETISALGRDGLLGYVPEDGSIGHMSGLVSYAFRQRLVHDHGIEGLADLQRDLAAATLGFWTTNREHMASDALPLIQANTRFAALTVYMLENIIDPVLATFHRVGADTERAHFIHGMLFGHRDGSPRRTHGLLMVGHRLMIDLGVGVMESDSLDPSDEQVGPNLRTLIVVEHALASDAIGRENWSSGLRHAQRSLQAAAAVDEELVPRQEQLSHLAMTLARLGDLGAARNALRELEDWAGQDADRRRFVEGLENSLSPQLAYGARIEPFDSSERFFVAKALESAGDLEGALAAHLDEVVESRLADDQRHLARELMEAGRLVTLMANADVELLERAVAWTEESIRLRYALQMPKGRSYYLLGCLYEGLDQWELAQSALDIAAAECLPQDLADRVDITYERGLLTMRAAGDEPDERSILRAIGLLREAGDGYRELGHVDFEGDARLLAVQLCVWIERYDLAIPFWDSVIAIEESRVPSARRTAAIEELLEELTTAGVLGGE
jgi:tetratricopeptide (TPR) repeat protein